MKTKRVLTFFEYLITTFGWIYFFVFLYILLNNIHVGFVPISFRSIGIYNSMSIIEITLLFFVSSIFLLLSWSIYNKKKFGSLTRRKFPFETTKEDLSNAYKITVEEIIDVQNCKWVER
ncbi:MAG: poly-beta-1,6-N-acetyl-D-glucosamine biosynthesis protein PgaD [Bacillus sp. (in: firmicutes)]